MDELLRHNDLPFGGDDDGSHQSPAQALREKSLAAVSRIRACVTTAKTKLGQVHVPARVTGAAARVRTAVARHPVSPMLYIAVAGLIAGAVIFQSTYIRAYAVQVDGVEVGLVADTADVDAAVSHVESRVASVLGASYDYDAEVTYTPVFSTQDALTDAQDIEAYLFENTDALMDGFVLTVGGQEIGAAASQADLDALLDRVAAPYITEDTVDYGFVEDVSITSRQMSSDTDFDLEAIYAALTANSVEEAVYVVEKGDTFSRIAKSLDMASDGIVALNGMVRTAYAADCVERAVPYLQAAIEADMQAEAMRVTLAGCFISLDRKDEARELLEKVLADNPANESARALLQTLSA